MTDSTDDMVSRLRELNLHPEDLFGIADMIERLDQRVRYLEYWLDQARKNADQIELDSQMALNHDGNYE